MRGSRKFCQRGSKFDSFFLFFFSVDEGREDPNTTISRPSFGPSAKHHLNGVLLACRWWPHIDCRLGSFVVSRVSWPVLLRNPILLWFLGEGFRPPIPPFKSTHVNAHTYLCSTAKGPSQQHYQWWPTFRCLLGRSTSMLYVYKQRRLNWVFFAGWCDIKAVIFTCASCIFYSLFCLLGAKFFFQRVQECNHGIAEMPWKIVLWTHKSAFGPIDKGHSESQDP